MPEAASLPSTTADDAAGNVTVTTTQALAADATAPASTSRAPDTDSTGTAPTTAAPASPGDGTETTDTATPASEAPAEPAAADAAAPTSSANGTETTETAAPTTAVPPTTAAPTTAAPEPSIDGLAVFLEATCDSCHRGDGDGTGADLRASTLERDAVIEVIRFGVAGTEMDGWDFEPKPPGLTRAEIEAVATYVMTLRSG